MAEELLQPCPHCGYFQPKDACGLCRGRVLEQPLGEPIKPGRRFAPRDIAHGFALFFATAMRLLTQPQYFGKLAVPVFANLAAIAVVVAIAWFGVYPAAIWLTEQPWATLEPLLGFATYEPDSLAMVLTLVTLVMLAPALIQTLTLPFLDALSDSVEQTLAGPELAAFGRSVWGDVVVNVRASAQVLAMQLVVLVPCLLLSFCHLGLLIALVVSAHLNALLWLEIPCARRGYTLDQRILIARRNWARVLGFGLAIQVGLFIPFFNLVLLAPTAATAASTLYFYFEKVPPDAIVRPRRREP